MYRQPSYMTYCRIDIIEIVKIQKSTIVRNSNLYITN